MTESVTCYFGSVAETLVKSKLVKNLLQYTVGLGLLAYIISSNWDTKPGKLNAKGELGEPSPGLSELFSKPINYSALALAFILFSLALLLTFVRWHLLVRAQGLVFPLRNAIRLGLVSFFFNTFLPGSVGGDILKAVAVAREQNRRTVAIATIIIDRIIGLWALALFVVLSGGFFWLIRHPVLMTNEALQTIVLVATTLVTVSGLLWFSLGFLSPLKMEAIATKFSTYRKIGGSLAEFWRACCMYRRKTKEVLIALGMALLGHIGWVFIFHLCVAAFPHLNLATYAEHMLIVPVGVTAQAAFPLPGGIGGGEAAYGWLYTLLNRPASSGIVGCLVMRVLAWTVGFVGFLIYTQLKKEEVTPTEPAQVAA